LYSWNWRVQHIYPWFFYLRQDRETFGTGNAVNSIKDRLFEEIEDNLK
jgi:hypothetical protein